MAIVWDVLVRIGKPERFPCDSTYGKYNDMPEARLNDWQEAIVGLVAHEVAHIQFNYAGGDRKGSETNAEWIEIDCVEQFRKDRSLFNEFLAKELERESEKAIAIAAKRSPESVASAELAKAEAGVKKWTRRAKLAATKLKLYGRAKRRAEKKVANLSINMSQDVAS